MFDTKYGKEEAEEEDAKFFNEAHVNRIYIVMIAIFSGFKALPLWNYLSLSDKDIILIIAFLIAQGVENVVPISLTQKYYFSFVYSCSSGLCNFRAILLQD